MSYCYIMITQQDIKYIRSLRQNKFRKIHNEFIIEGPKSILELINTKIKILKIYALETWIEDNINIISNVNYEIIKEKQLKQLSNQKTPNQAIAIAEIPEHKLAPSIFNNELILVLDNINDPGNFGTIIRTADWFGIKHIICSTDTVDAYNPKIVQASMGSIGRVNIYYEYLQAMLSSVAHSIPVYGTFINAENINKKTNNHKNALVIIGNEANGISKELLPFIKHKITIPSYKNENNNSQVESLNASVATAIICYFFRFM